MAELDTERIVAAFEAAGARWALVGAHAVGLYTAPRAMVDFDFVVEGRKLAAVVEHLGVAFGDLDIEDIGAAVRLRAIDVDLIRSTHHPLFAEADLHRISQPQSGLSLAAGIAHPGSPDRSRGLPHPVLDSCAIGPLRLPRG